MNEKETRKVRWDDQAIRFVEDEREVSSIPWNVVRRIAYVTENTGVAITDDHFLAIVTDRRCTLISLGLDGALDLVKAVDRLFGCRYGDKGTLAYSTADDSVVVWPLEESGRTLEEMWARSGPEKIWMAYATEDLLPAPLETDLEADAAAGHEPPDAETKFRRRMFCLIGACVILSFLSPFSLLFPGEWKAAGVVCFSFATVVGMYAGRLMAKSSSWGTGRLSSVWFQAWIVLVVPITLLIWQLLSWRLR